MLKGHYNLLNQELKSNEDSFNIRLYDLIIHSYKLFQIY